MAGGLKNAEQSDRPPSEGNLIRHRSVHDRTIDSEEYKPIIYDAERYRDLIEAELIHHIYT